MQTASLCHLGFKSCCRQCGRADDFPGIRPVPRWLWDAFAYQDSINGCNSDVLAHRRCGYRGYCRKRNRRSWVQAPVSPRMTSRFALRLALSAADPPTHCRPKRHVSSGFAFLVPNEWRPDTRLPIPRTCRSPSRPRFRCHSCCSSFEFLSLVKPFTLPEGLDPPGKPKTSTLLTQAANI